MSFLLSHSLTSLSIYFINTCWNAPPSMMFHFKVSHTKRISIHKLTQCWISNVFHQSVIADWRFRTTKVTFYYFKANHRQKLFLWWTWGNGSIFMLSGFSVRLREFHNTHQDKFETGGPPAKMINTNTTNEISHGFSVIMLNIFKYRSSHCCYNHCSLFLHRTVQLCLWRVASTIFLHSDLIHLSRQSALVTSCLLIRMGPIFILISNAENLNLNTKAAQTTLIIALVLMPAGMTMGRVVTTCKTTK